MILVPTSLALAVNIAILTLSDVPLSSGVSPHLRTEHHHHSKHSTSNNNGQSTNANFDFYVYSMTYQPEFCRENSSKFVGCKRPSQYWEGQLTIHGLWPQRLDGTWPSSCTTEPLGDFYERGGESILNDLEVKWPNVKAEKDSSSHEEFWAHEWSKHGTCSGLVQFDYFHSALGLLLDTPPLVREGYGTTVDREALVQGYGGESMAALVCKSGYLSEVRACFEKGVDGMPGGRMECPNKVLEENSCGEKVAIASFGKDEMLSEKEMVAESVL